MKGRNMFDLVMQVIEGSGSEGFFRPFTFGSKYMWVNFVYVAVRVLSFLGIVTIW